MKRIIKTLAQLYRYFDPEMQYASELLIPPTYEVAQSLLAELTQGRPLNGSEQFQASEIR